MTQSRALKWRTPALVTALAAVTMLAGCGSRSHGNDAPAISSVADQTLDPDISTSALAFNVTDHETAASQLQVTASSDNTALVPATAIQLAGSGNTRSVQVTPASDQFGSATITLTVTDDHGNRASTRFVITVRDTRQAFASYSRTLYASDSNDAATDINSLKFTFDTSEAPDAYDDLLNAM